MAVAAILSIMIAWISAVRWRRVIGSGLSPVTLYGLGWGVIFLIILSGFHGYFPISIKGMTVANLALFGLFIGESLGLPSKRIETTEVWPIDNEIFRRWVIIMGVGSFVVGAIALASAYYLFGNVITNAYVVKSTKLLIGAEATYANTPFGFLIKFYFILRGVFLPASLLAILYVRFVNPKAWFLLMLPALGCIFYDFSWGTRSVFHWVIAPYIFGVMFLPVKSAPSGMATKSLGKMNSRNLALLAGVAVMVIASLVTANIVGSSVRQSDVRVVNGVEVPLIVADVLAYPSASFVAFDQSLGETPLDGWTMGRLTFMGFEIAGRYTQLLPKFDLPLEMNTWEMATRVSSTMSMMESNIYTWFRYLYSDFGYVGSFLLPMIFGVMIGKLAGKVNGPTWFTSLMMLGLWDYVLYKSPIIMEFRNEFFVFSILMVAVIVYQINRPIRERLKSMEAAEEIQTSNG